MRGTVQTTMMSVSKAVGTVTVLVILCAWAYIAFTGEPRLQIGIANGHYSNGCCGMIVLHDGMITVESHSIKYVIERDKEGPYVLPMAYVGASAHGFVVRSDVYPLKLRLDVLARPHQIELLDDAAGGQGYQFARADGS